MNRKKNAKIRTRLLLVILASGALAVLLLLFLWTHYWDAWNLASRFPPFYWDEEGLAAQIIEEAKKYDLPDSEGDKETAKAMEPIFDFCDEYTAIGIYGTDGYYRLSHPASIFVDEERPWLLFMSNAVELLFMDPDRIYSQFYSVSFRNAEAEFYIMDYHPVLFLYPYMLISAFFCIFVFLTPILFYINSRIRDILMVSREILLMASGDLSHPLPSAGTDEIGMLARELDQLRLTLSDHIHQEYEARKSNQDLITAMSHDLRTPLTILNGYLEILKLKGNDSDTRSVYLERCLAKSMEIRHLTDRMFEYALVYEAEESPDFTQLPVQFIVECLIDNLDFIRLAGFTADMPPFPATGTLYGDETMIKRIFQNIFSNVIKYGEKKTAVSLETEIENGTLTIRISNAIKQDRSNISGNQIGLKSVKKMVELHGGSFSCQKEALCFRTTIMLPMAASGNR